MFTGRVTGEDGEPLAGAELDVWHADAKGLYSGFDPTLPEGILRGKVLTDDDGRYEVRTIVPAPVHDPRGRPDRRHGPRGGLEPVAPGPHPPRS